MRAGHQQWQLPLKTSAVRGCRLQAATVRSVACAVWRPGRGRSQNVPRHAPENSERHALPTVWLRLLPFHVRAVPLKRSELLNQGWRQLILRSCRQQVKTKPTPCRKSCCKTAAKIWGMGNSLGQMERAKGFEALARGYEGAKRCIQIRFIPSEMNTTGNRVEPKHHRFAANCCKTSLMPAKTSNGNAAGECRAGIVM